MKTLIITGGKFNKEFAVSFLEKNKYDYVIAVDRGLFHCESIGIVPNAIVGDFDSYEEVNWSFYEGKGVKIRRYQPEKDDTDTEIAIKLATEMKSDMDILGGMGGRIDHLLANIHNLLIAEEEGLTARVIDEGNVVYLKNSSFEINGDECIGKYISFVPFAGVVRGIKLKGFKYLLDGYDLKPGVSRCISNELVDVKGFVEFDEGCLIVVNSRDVDK